MPKLKMTIWKSTSGETAVSFPTQEFRSSPSPIVRRAHDAADHAASVLVNYWEQTAGQNISPGLMKHYDYRMYIIKRRDDYRARATRRYKKLFKAMGLK